jgi:DNA replicative helicase MCM subunit Mcm2 (Cdc46/Mcm family)
MLQVLLDAIYEVQRETGLAELNVVLDEAEKRGISRSECERLISQLKREGTIYEPREGYLKKT